MFELDKYTIKARLYPSLLVLLPIFVVSIYYITDFEKYYHYFTAIIGLGLFTFLLSQLGRDNGKNKEPYLYNYFGGKPTTQILRHRNEYIDVHTKKRYHNMLSQKIDNLKIPTIEEETNDPGYSDQVYESCARFLISKTRNITQFNLLFKENINYGFRRNLWGMKNWSLSILFCCLILHTYIVSTYFTTLSCIESKDIFLFVYLILALLFWLFVVTKKWIKSTAFAYAERLLETLNEIN